MSALLQNGVILDCNEYSRKETIVERRKIIKISILIINGMKFMSREAKEIAKKFELSPEELEKLYAQFRESLNSPKIAEEIQDLIKAVDAADKFFFAEAVERHQKLYKTFQTDLLGIIRQDFISMGFQNTMFELIEKAREDLKNEPSIYLTEQDLKDYKEAYRKMQLMQKFILVQNNTLQEIHEQLVHSLEFLSNITGYTITPEEFLSPNFKETYLDRLKKLS